MPGFSGQGVAYIAPRLASGLPGIFRDFGNASIFKVSQSADTTERKESRTGSRLPFRRLTKSQGGTIQLVGDEFNSANFSLATQGVSTVVAAGAAVTGYALPTGALVGDTLVLPAKNVSDVVIKDSTATPKVLTLNTHYSLDPFSGAVKLLDLTTGGAYVQPFKADFTPGTVEVIGAFKAPNTEYFLRLDGVNTDDGNKRGICDVFRVSFSPAKVLDLISDDYMDWDLEGTIMADLTRSAASPEGQFWSWTRAAA